MVSEFAFCAIHIRPLLSRKRDSCIGLHKVVCQSKVSLKVQVFKTDMGFGAPPDTRFTKTRISTFKDNDRAD